MIEDVKARAAEVRQLVESLPRLLQVGEFELQRVERRGFGVEGGQCHRGTPATQRARRHGSCASDALNSRSQLAYAPLWCAVGERCHGSKSRTPRPRGVPRCGFAAGGAPIIAARPDGEIGRRSGLKIRGPQGCTGSSPVPGTT